MMGFCAPITGSNRFCSLISQWAARNDLEPVARWLIAGAAEKRAAVSSQVAADKDGVARVSRCREQSKEREGQQMPAKLAVGGVQDAASPIAGQGVWALAFPGARISGAATMLDL